MFQYQVAEAVLDKWCLDLGRPPGFRRAYVKLKLGLYALAYVDYNEQGKLTEAVRACAWEELQITCTARGEACTSGLLAQVWHNCRVEEKPDLRKLFETAFALAEGATAKDAERLYPKKYRLADFEWLADTPPDWEPVAPYRGPRLVDLCIEFGWDITKTLATFAELMKREVEGDEVEEVEWQRPKLELLEGGHDEGI